VSGVVVACAVRAPAGPERTDDVLGPRSGWLVAKVGACGVASSNRPALARRLRDTHVCPRFRSLWRPTLTNPPVLTPLILGPAPNLPGCKRLHLTFGPSRAAKWSGRAETRILGSPGRTSLTSPPVLTPLTLPPYVATPHQPSCKRLHLTFSPSWAAKSSGRAKTRILGNPGRTSLTNPPALTPLILSPAP